MIDPALLERLVSQAPELLAIVDRCEALADRPQTSYGDALKLRRISFAAQRLRREITAAGAG